MLRLVSTNAIISHGKIDKLELFEELLHTMLKMQPEMTEAGNLTTFMYICETKHD